MSSDRDVDDFEEQEYPDDAELAGDDMGAMYPQAMLARNVIADTRGAITRGGLRPINDLRQQAMTVKDLRLIGNLGNTIIASQIFEVVADCRLSDNAIASPLTVFLVDLDGPNSSIEKIARIEFGSAGFQGAAQEINFNRNRIISISASWVRVLARQAQAGSPGRVGAFVTLGHHSKSLPTHADVKLEIGAGATQTLELIPFAHYWRMYANEPCEVQLNNIIVTVPANTLSEWFPFADSVPPTDILVKNTGLTTLEGVFWYGLEL